MSGPNNPLQPGQNQLGIGSNAEDNLSGFDSLRSLVENEERILDLLRQRNAGFEQLIDPPTITGGSIVSGKVSGQGQSRGPYVQRTAPMIMTTESFAAQGRYILFWAGPESVQWQFPIRASQQQTRSGTILHTWRNGSRSTFFDEPEMNITFQAGNIMPVRLSRGDSDGGTISKTKAEVVALPQGLFDFYEFFELLDEEKILPDGRPNFVFISYHSLVYPDIFLRGFFTPQGVQFSENAQDPANLKWTSTFKIRSTEPPFYNSAQLVSSWRAAYQGTGVVALAP